MCNVTYAVGGNVKPGIAAAECAVAECAGARRAGSRWFGDVSLWMALCLVTATHLSAAPSAHAHDGNRSDATPAQAAEPVSSAGVTGTDVPGTTVLAVDGTRFTVNGQSVFLLGCSYYGGLGASEEFIRRDLDDLQHHGFNWLRVWATWGAFDNDVSAVDEAGEPHELYLQKLQWLVAECDRRGMIVDVTLTRGQRSEKSLAGGNLPDFAAHRRAVDVIVTELKQHRNWYLDLANERDVGDARFVSIDELKTLRAVVRELDPQRLVTASFGGHDLSSNDVRDSLIDAGQDFLSVHRPRNPRSAAQTEFRTRELLSTCSQLKETVPVHHQEPFRRGYGTWEPTAEDFLTDLRGAVAGGAAGWCFHNGSQRTSEDGRPRRSFDLRTQRLMEQLDEEELSVIQRAHAAAALVRN